MNAVPVELQLIWAWYTARVREVREDGDRGEIINAAIVIGILAAAALIVGAILVTKAKQAANNITVQ